MTAHSLLHAPSSAARRLQCAGSARAEAACPDDESEDAREGTAAHWVLEQAFAGFWVPIGTVAPNGVVVSDEMLEGAAIAVPFFKSRVPSPAVEMRIAAPRMHPDCFGTLDMAGLDAKGELHIADYKFGHGYVEVFENPQLAEYASGFCDLLPQGDKIWINFHVIQPRCYVGEQCRTWRVWGEDLRGFWNKLAAAEDAAESLNAPRKTGRECGDCRARHACLQLQREGADAVEVSRCSPPLEMSNDAIGLELRTILRAEKLLEARRTGLEALAMGKCMAGESIAGFRVGSTSPRERWAKPIAEVLTLGQLFGKDLAKPAVAITPAQARAAGVPDFLVDQYSERPAGTAKLVQVSTTDAAKAFYQKD